MKNDMTLCVMDIRRSPTSAPLIHRVNENSEEAKRVSLKLYTGDLWIRNPEAHIYIMVDGYMATGDVSRSLRGRGVCVGNVPTGMGLSFEHFGEDEFMVGPFEPLVFLPNEFYDLSVVCDKERIEYKFSGPGVEVFSKHSFSTDYPNFDTVIGVAGDYESSTYGFFNVKQSMSKYFYTSRELSV